MLTLVQIMTEKGLLDRDDGVRPQLYSARQKQSHTQQHLLRDFIDRAYGGSVRSLVMHALSTKKPSAKRPRGTRSAAGSIRERRRMSNLTSAFVSALIEFVWQGAAVGVTAAIGLLAMRRSSPQARYALCAGALIVMVALPIVTTTRRYSRTTVPESTISNRFGVLSTSTW